jgi:hypothetical protein
MHSISNLSCQNKKCRDFGKRKANNLYVCGWLGINNQIRILYCRTCKSRFSEIKTSQIQKNREENKKIELLSEKSTKIPDLLQKIQSTLLN